MEASQPIRCSFCGKSQSDTLKIIVGPTNCFICSECVDLCRDILDEEPLEGASDTRRAVLSPRTPLRVLDRAAAARVANRLCGRCERIHTPDMLVFAAVETTTPAATGSVSHTITVEECGVAPMLICLACAQELLLKSLEKRTCAMCHQSRLVHEFPDSSLRVCIRCAQTTKWLLEHRDSEPDVLMAMRTLLAGGMHVLFDRVVSAAKNGSLRRMGFEGTALQALRSAGLIPKDAFGVPTAAVGFIADSCHSDGVWLRIESERVPEAGISFTAPTL